MRCYLRVALVAADTATSLLQSADGQEAYAAKNCPSEVRTLLKPFLDVRRSSSGATLSPSQSSPPMNRGGGSGKHNEFLSLSEFQSRSLWAPSYGNSYGAWVCNLTARLLLDCYEQPGSVTTTLTPPPSTTVNSTHGAIAAAAGAGARGGMASPAVRCGLVGRDDFYRHCRPMAALRPAFAELLFPAVIDDLTR